MNSMLLFQYFGWAGALVLVIGFYGLLVSDNLIRTLIAVEILSKVMVLALFTVEQMRQTCHRLHPQERTSQQSSFCLLMVRATPASHLSKRHKKQQTMACGFTRLGSALCKEPFFNRPAVVDRVADREVVAEEVVVVFALSSTKRRFNASPR